MDRLIAESSPGLGQHVAGEVGSDDPGVGIGTAQQGGDIAGPGGQIEDPAAAGIAGPGDDEATPALVLAQRHRPVHQVVTAGDGIEHPLNPGPLAHADVPSRSAVTPPIILSMGRTPGSAGRG